MGSKTWSNVVFQVSVIIAFVTILRASESSSDRESIRSVIEHELEEALSEDKGTGCDIPKTDPFAHEIMQFDKKPPPITCSGVDWVKCYLSSCKPVPEAVSSVKNLVCEYMDILYKSDNSYELGHKTVFVGEHEYKLDDSDHVDIRCKGDSNMFGTSWRGHGAAFRSLTPKTPPPGREKTYNVLMFGFDSTSKNNFIRKMPKTYKFLQEELNSVILDGYNVVGDGTPAALFPILTGKTELELPECRRSIQGSGHLDSMPFIFYKLKEDGYRTTYFEDSPSTGTFQYRLNGFLHQPADHYLRAFYLEAAKYNSNREVLETTFCLGATPRYKFMMNLTDQFFQLNGKKFGFTFVVDISHDDPNYLGSADDDLVALLRGLLLRGVFRDTLFMLMSDHGNRFASVRATLQGKLEERLPLMAIRLPDYLVSHRPDALDALKLNADVLTTPHDIHATILDALDMRQHYNPYKVKGADLPRGLSLLHPISKNRTCSEAGIEKHWCACLKWESLGTTDPMYERTAKALVDYINSLTAFVGHLCARRNLTSISWVMRKKPNDRVLAFRETMDGDGYLGDFNSKADYTKKTAYQIKIEVGPGKGVYEASVTHHHKPDTMTVSSREISRTNPWRSLKRFLKRRQQSLWCIAFMLFMICFWCTRENRITQTDAIINNIQDDKFIFPKKEILDISKKTTKITIKKNAKSKKIKAKLFKFPQANVLRQVGKELEEALREDKGTGCDIPKTDPFAQEIMKFSKEYPPITCPGVDWVKCHMSTCKPDPVVLSLVKSLKCKYVDIIYKSDHVYILGPERVIKGDHEYKLNVSDHVFIDCEGNGIKNMTSLIGNSWKGVSAGFRPLTPKTPPPGREKTYNVLIFGFDSTSKNLFFRKMPKSYRFLQTELKAVILNGYNIVGDGTPAALFPILTGKTELELPECRKSIIGSGHTDSMPFIFYKLKDDGYRTAYFEDMPWVGTFQYRFRGFLHQPADHYLRDFYLEADNFNRRSFPFCLGSTPRYKFMMNLTDQFFQLDGKKFALTFLADITHDDPNYLGDADDALVELLRGLMKKGVFNDTLLVLMGDHGSRFSPLRATLAGKLEERLPLMAIRLPDSFVAQRPDALNALTLNADVLTTPHDIHATVLDVMDMTQHWNDYKVKGADLTRALTLLKRIPKSRSCSEAGIERHWCTCLKWEKLKLSDPLYQRTAQALVDHINSITGFVSNLCARRNLTAISWVMRKKPNDRVLEHVGTQDEDGYRGIFGKKTISDKQAYQVTIEVGPGLGVYEATVTHVLKPDELVINTREISRTNRYNDEPSCISSTYPHLNPYCYCKWKKNSSIVNLLFLIVFCLLLFFYYVVICVVCFFFGFFFLF